MSHLPDPNTPVGEKSWYSAPALEAVGRLSPKAPPEFLELARAIALTKDVTNDHWWRVRENVARCLGKIGDKTAVEPLQEARRALETGYQDYGTWYAVRKALAAIDPQAMPLNRPAADILRQIQWGKGGFSGLEPLVKLGDSAMDDLAWMLLFEGRQDRERVADAMRVLGQIGGEQAVSILRDYIARPPKPQPPEDPLLSATKRFDREAQA
jgi:HEAT repeat protein